MAKKRTKRTTEDVDIAQLVAGWEDVTVESLLAMLGDVAEPDASMLGDVQVPDDPRPGAVDVLVLLADLVNENSVNRS
jgi:hypothetical protein